MRETSIGGFVLFQATVNNFFINCCFDYKPHSKDTESADDHSTESNLRNQFHTEVPLSILC